MLKISRANGIMFKAVDGLMMNFQNTLSCESFKGIIGYRFSHKYYNTDQIPIQLEADYPPELTYYFDDGTSIPIYAFAQDLSAAGTIFFSYKLNQQKSGYLVAKSGNDTFISERIEIVLNAPILVEWFNYEDAFGYHYRDEMVNFARFDGFLIGYAPKGTTKVFDNQDEQVKVKETLWRTMKLTLEVVPQTVAEQLTIAAAHDVLVVNDREYVTDSLPKITQLGRSTLYDVELTLIEKQAIGHNSHDSGYDPDLPNYYKSINDEQFTDINSNKYTD